MLSRRSGISWSSFITHHLEAWQEVNAIAREQELILLDELWLANAKEFQGRHTIRSDDGLVASLLCKCPTKV